MRPEHLSAGAVQQVNRLADLQPAIRRGADSRRIIGAAWPIGANFAQRAGDAVHFQVARLAQGKQGGIQVGVLCIEAIAEQMRFAAMEPGGHFDAGQIRHTTFLERVLEARQADEAVVVGQRGVAHPRRGQVCGQRFGGLLAIAEDGVTVEIDQDSVVHTQIGRGTTQTTRTKSRTYPRRRIRAFA